MLVHGRMLSHAEGPAERGRARPPLLEQDSFRGRGNRWTATITKFVSRIQHRIVGGDFGQP